MSNSTNNSADDWDNWGSSSEDMPQSEDIWASPSQDDTGIWDEDSNQNQDIGSWDDWGNNQQSQSDIWNEDNSQSQNIDNWDDWKNQGANNQQGQSDIWGSQPQGSFIPQDNNLDSNQNNFLPQDDGMTQSYQNFDDSGDLTSQVQQSPVRFNLSPKKASLIIAGVLIILAIILMFVDSIKITPKKEQTQQVQQQSSTSQNPQPTQPVQQSQVGTSQGSAVLVEVPDSMSINYSGDIQEANGKVIAKKKYVQGHQILYCITINISFGSASENVSYYCNYNSYNQVSVSDVVVITYQQVNDSYISVNAIQK